MLLAGDARQDGSRNFAGNNQTAYRNYRPCVEPSDQTSLNTGLVSFAKYMNQIHNRIHPIFADTYLTSFGALPSSNPLNQMDLQSDSRVSYRWQFGQSR